MATWYYVEDNRQAGPLTDEQLSELVTQGRIQAATLVWNESMANWQPYAQVRAAACSGRPGPTTGTASAPPRTPTPLREAVLGANRHGDWRDHLRRVWPGLPPDEVVPVNGVGLCGQAARFKLREGLGGATAMTYAGFWIRFAAKIIDGLILFVVNLGVGLAVQGGFTAAGAAAGHATAAGIAGMVMAWLLQMGLGLVYTVFFLGRFGATPGKMACGLLVVRADGSPISYGRAVGRHFADILSGLTLCIGYLIAAFDSEKRALHDHICDTRVITK